LNQDKNEINKEVGTVIEASLIVQIGTDIEAVLEAFEPPGLKQINKSGSVDEGRNFSKKEKRDIRELLGWSAGPTTCFTQLTKACRSTN